MTACEREMNSRNKNSHKTSHDYDPMIPQKNESNETDVAPIVEKNRWVWQRPELVIDKLGNIDNKTVADLGAGPRGYFSFFIAAKTMAKKVIALDIDEQALQFIQDAKKLLPEARRDKLETRLVQPDNAMLKPKEADVVLIVNTVTYFENRVEYLKNLAKGIAPGGRLVIVDFKKRITTIGPNVEERLAIGELEMDLLNAGYEKVEVDDCSLEYQYVVTASI